MDAETISQFLIQFVQNLLKTYKQYDRQQVQGDNERSYDSVFNFLVNSEEYTTEPEKQLAGENEIIL